MTAQQLLHRLIELLEKPLDPDEGFRFGDSLVEVRGILVCWVCDPDAIRAAAKRGANVIVCHEALYFPYDVVDGQSLGGEAHDFLSWPTNFQRVRMLVENGITVIRLHGSVDRLCILDRFAEQLELEQPVIDEGELVRIYEIPPRPAGELIKHVKLKLQLPALRAAVRDENRIVRRIGLPWGGLGLFVNCRYVNRLLLHRPDVLIAGETDNYGFRLATELNVDVIETSHELSEDAGLADFAQRIALICEPMNIPTKYHRCAIVWKMR